MDSSRRIEIAPHVHFTEVEGDYVLMDTKQGVYLGLDPVASHIWQSLSEHGDLDRAAQAVCERFEVEEDRAAADVKAWTDELVRRGLVRRVR